MNQMLCSVCREQIPDCRQGEKFPGKAPKLCGESCIAKAIEWYWDQRGFRTIGEFRGDPQSGGVRHYRLRDVVRKEAGKP